MKTFNLFFSLDSLCKELAEFYQASASSDSNFGMDQHEESESNIEEAGDDIEGWKLVMEKGWRERKGCSRSQKGGG